MLPDHALLAQRGQRIEAAVDQPIPMPSMSLTVNAAADVVDQHHVDTVKAESMRLASIERRMPSRL